jgi:D-3-phosphoglycerate dehydrogenase
MGFKAVATFYMPGLPYPDEVITSIGGEFDKAMCRTEDEIIECCKGADAATAPTSVTPYTRRVLEGLPRCRILASVGIGYESIDLEAATERGIVVTTVPDYCWEEVSDHALTLMMALGRKLLQVHSAVLKGGWGTTPDVRRGLLPPMFRFKGQTLGVIGFGSIGRTLALKVRSLGMPVIAYDPFASREVMLMFGVRKGSMEEVLRQSDYVSVHAAYTPESHHMLGREHFQAMKPTAYFINTARGHLVDEAALIEALRSKEIAGAGLDVMEDEPPKQDNPLLGLDNVILTGHTAQYTDESEMELWRKPLEEIASLMQGRWPRYVVNPQVRPKYEEKWGKLSKV